MSDTTENRFTDRTMTIQEAIWLERGEKGELEALVWWLEDRRNEDNQDLDIRSMPETQLPILVAEALEGCKRAKEVTLYLEGLQKRLEKDIP